MTEKLTRLGDDSVVMAAARVFATASSAPEAHEAATLLLQACLALADAAATGESDPFSGLVGTVAGAVTGLWKELKAWSTQAQVTASISGNVGAGFDRWEQFALSVGRVVGMLGAATVRSLVAINGGGAAANSNIVLVGDKQHQYNALLQASEIALALLSQQWASGQNSVDLRNDALAFYEGGLEAYNALPAGSQKSWISTELRSWMEEFVRSALTVGTRGRNGSCAEADEVIPDR